MLENMQATYDTFVEKAAQGRNTTPEKIDAIGQGRVWTGRQAKEIGLVDELGGLDRAVALAKQRAKIAQDAEVELVIYPPKKSFYDIAREPFGSVGPRRDARRRCSVSRTRRRCRRSPRRCRSSAAASRWR